VIGQIVISIQIRKLIGRDGQAFVNTRVTHVIQSFKILEIFIVSIKISKICEDYILYTIAIVNLKSF